MLTDLRLRKYLEGRLSRRQEAEIEELLEKNPALRQRLEELGSREHSVSRPMWERLLLGRDARRGSRVRYTTLLPALVLLILVLAITSHWFGKPGASSTFTHVAGSGTSVDLLYNSPRGWRYLDAGFRPGDSLTIAVKDSGRYAVRVIGLGPEPDAKAWFIWPGPASAFYGPKDPKPVFSSLPRGADAPAFLAVVYDTSSLEDFALEQAPDFLDGEGSARGAGYRFQVFRVSQPGANP